MIDPMRADLGRRLILKAALSSFGLLLPQRLFAADAVGLIKDVQGTAVVRRGPGERPAATGDAILVEDVAVTGAQPARLQLQFAAGTQVRLGANTVFEVERFVVGLAQAMQLHQGAALIEHDSKAGPDLTLRSPFALLAARGTAFFAGPSNAPFAVFVREGLVEVGTPRGSVTLSAGEGTDLAAPGAMPTPPLRWGEPRIRAALASVT